MLKQSKLLPYSAPRSRQWKMKNEACMTALLLWVYLRSRRIIIRSEIEKNASSFSSHCFVDSGKLFPLFSNLKQFIISTNAHRRPLFITKPKSEKNNSVGRRSEGFGLPSKVQCIPITSFPSLLLVPSFLINTTHFYFFHIQNHLPMTTVIGFLCYIRS